MILEHLVGTHMLGGVDESTEHIKSEYGDYYADCNIIRFELDGKVYEVIEDHNDGYRSAMGEIKSSRRKIKNRFGPIEVVAIYRDKKSYGYCAHMDILEMVDAITGKVILEVGTDYSDSYYPSFVASFTPEDMVINCVKKKKVWVRK